MLSTFSHHLSKADFRYHPTDGEPDSSPPSTPQSERVQSEAETVLETLSKPMSSEVGLRTYHALITAADNRRKVCIFQRRSSYKPDSAFLNLFGTVRPFSRPNSSLHQTSLARDSYLAWCWSCCSICQGFNRSCRWHPALDHSGASPKCLPDI